MIISVGYYTFNYKKGICQSYCIFCMRLCHVVFLNIQKDYNVFIYFVKCTVNRHIQNINRHIMMNMQKLITLINFSYIVRYISTLQQVPQKQRRKKLFFGDVYEKKTQHSALKRVVCIIVCRHMDYIPYNIKLLNFSRMLNIM